MELSLNQIQGFAKTLKLNNLSDSISCLIEGQAYVGENLNVLVLTMHNYPAKFFLKGYFEDNAFISKLFPCQIVFSGSFNNVYQVETEVGKVNVGKSTLIDYISSKKQNIIVANCSAIKGQPQNINITFLYISELDYYTKNEWLLKLSSFDKVYYVLDGMQIFSKQEKIFFDNILYPLFSNTRLSLIVGNSSLMSEADRNEVIDYANTIAREGVLILYSDVVPEYDILFNDICSYGSNAIEIRVLMEQEITNYARWALLSELPDLKEQLIDNNNDVEKAISLLSNNSSFVSESKLKIQKKIDSFIKEYIYYQFEKKVRNFNEEFTSALQDDIKASSNIDEDGKWLNKYMEHIWSIFMTDQESWIKSELVSESANIERLIDNDIHGIISQMDIKSQKLIKDFLSTKYLVHSYLVGKENKTEAEELSKTLKITSLALLLISPAGGILSFAGSELVKKVFFQQIDEGKKEKLSLASEKMTAKMADQILEQATSQFATIADDLKRQTIAIYQNILNEIEHVLKEKIIGKDENAACLDLIRSIETF